MNISDILEFYNGKKVLVTGHTGFKGSWMLSVLEKCGAQICGYALMPPTDPSLFKLLGYMTDSNRGGEIIKEVAEGADTKLGSTSIGSNGASLTNVYADICDLDKLKDTFASFQPEIVIHMAAQPIVRESYRDPVGTYATNVMGTVNVMECIRQTPSVKSFINVTTDKVYKNRERQEGYREEEELNGYDPYSNSKSCSELVTDSYKKSFFVDEETGESKLPDGRRVAITTMRAGNVIGGGDFAKDRIIPDCVKAAMKGGDIIVRNPYSIRPYQHVLEPVCMYLYVAMKQYENINFASSYNIGPRDEDCWTTGEITTAFCDIWNEASRMSVEDCDIDKIKSNSDNTDVKWINKHDGGPHEATFLKLNCSKVRDTFGWKPVWSVRDAMEKIVEWSKVYETDNSVKFMKSVTNRQIEQYLGI